MTSFWRRWLGRPEPRDAEDGPPEDDPPAAAVAGAAVDDVASVPPPGPPREPREDRVDPDAEDLLDALVARIAGGEAVPAGAVAEVLDRAIAERSMRRALRSLRPLVGVVPRGAWQVEAARRADRIGETGLAEELLAPFADPGVPLEVAGESSKTRTAAHALAAELAERRGDRDRARRLWEWIVEEDRAGHPAALDRARRLAAGGDRSADEAVLAGGTVLAEAARLGGGRYRIVREVGRGGAGIVFLARDEALGGRPTAPKLVRRQGRGDRARLRREGRVAAGLRHPGIVRVHDLDEELGALSLEWLPARSLRQALDRGATVPAARVVRWLETTLEALAVVHGAGLVHRDLKPSNMLLREDDRVVLTDFGLSLGIGEAARVPGEGTLRYMAPEQRAGAPADPAADIHAFARSADELLALIDDPAARAALRGALAPGAARDPSARPEGRRVAEALLAAAGRPK